MSAKLTPTMPIHYSSARGVAQISPKFAGAHLKLIAQFSSYILHFTIETRNIDRVALEDSKLKGELMKNPKRILFVLLFNLCVYLGVFTIARGGFDLSYILRNSYFLLVVYIIHIILIVRKKNITISSLSRNRWIALMILNGIFVILFAWIFGIVKGIVLAIFVIFSLLVQRKIEAHLD